MPKAEHVSPGGVTLLQEPHLAHFATSLPDNTLQVTPVWVDVEPDGSHVLINTAKGRLKTENIEKNPKLPSASWIKPTIGATSPCAAQSTLR